MNFEEVEEGGVDQKWFLELLQAKARQLKILDSSDKRYELIFLKDSFSNSSPKQISKLIYQLIKYLLG